MVKHTSKTVQGSLSDHTDGRRKKEVLSVSEVVN